MSAFSILSIFCLLIPSVLSLGFLNSQLPSIPIASKPGLGVGKVDPRLKFAPSYVQQLQPWGDKVLLSIVQADSNQGFQQTWATESRAVIVRTGTGVTDTSLIEGATVLIDRASTCTSKYASPTAYALAGNLEWFSVTRSFWGKYMNGVSLNNAYPLTMNGEFPRAPPGTGNTATTDTANWDETAAVQQDNYVLCPTSNILGVISTASWGANRANAGTSYIQKPALWTQKTNGYTLY